jgi:hypothetical protein
MKNYKILLEVTCIFHFIIFIFHLKNVFYVKH